MMRDTLPQDLYAFRRFHTTTWNASFIRNHMRVLYLDGQTTTLPGYRVHSVHAPWEFSLEQLPNMFFENAVLGHFGTLPIDICNHHYFTPSEWSGYSDFLAQALDIDTNKNDNALVWFANRDEGSNRGKLADELLQNVRTNIVAMDTTILVKIEPPGQMEWRDQIRLARSSRVIVGPHGANLVNIVASGGNVSIVEIVTGSSTSSWYAQQCAYQGMRWFSTQNNVDSIVTSIRKALDPSYTPTCHYAFTEPIQMCV